MNDIFAHYREHGTGGTLLKEIVDMVLATWGQGGGVVRASQIRVVFGLAAARRYDGEAFAYVAWGYRSLRTRDPFVS